MPFISRDRAPLRAVLVVCSFIAAQGRAQRTPEGELGTLRVPSSMTVSLFASEPMIANPSAIDVDSRGRVWVAEIQWYRAKAKVPPADKIKVLEDTDGDGKADKMTVFADGLFCPMSICVAGDKVYVATSPDLWVFEDKDGDLKADGPPKKLLTGFGGINHDHGAHSLVLGPDHKWWMSHGDGGFNVKGTDGSRIEYPWGAMLRGELDGSKLEIVARNFRNPYELCVSSFGECFCSDNDNDGNQSTRICWIMEGGDYGWFKKPPQRVRPDVPFAEHWHFRGHIPGFVPATIMTGFGSPCGICFYEGDAFGASYKNAAWHADAGPREVRVYRHRTLGFGMKGSSEVVVSTGATGPSTPSEAADPYFRPDDVCAAPDGRLYVSDWYDGGVGGHAYNDPLRGRIFVVSPKHGKPRRVEKPGPYDSLEDALAGLASPNLATQYLARKRILAEGSSAATSLINLLKSDDPNLRARSLWLLDRLGESSKSAVVEQLRASDPSFRALAVRILARHGAVHEKSILPLAKDPAAEVRREVLLAMRHFASAASMEALTEIAKTFDGSDRYQLEAIHIAAGNRKKELFTRLDVKGDSNGAAFALLHVLDPERASRRFVERLARSGLKDLGGAAMLEAAARMPSPEVGRSFLQFCQKRSADAGLRQRALAMLEDNLKDEWRPLLDLAETESAWRKMLADEDLRPQVLDLLASFRIKKLGPDVLAIAMSKNVGADTRARAIRATWRLLPKDALPRLRELSQDPDVKTAAIRVLVELQDLSFLKKLFLNPDSNAALRAEAMQRLLSTPGGALFVSRLLEESSLPKVHRDEILKYASAHLDPSVRDQFRSHLPPEQRPPRLGEMVKPAEILAMKGDSARGEKIFHESSAAACKNCHSVHGIGGTVGPDLSRIGKKYERSALLETILDPSKAIAPEFISYVVETSEGEILVGLLVSKSDQEVCLKDAKGALVRVRAENVVRMVPQVKSLMPDLILKDVSAQDAADLLAYLSQLTDSIQTVTRFRVLGPFDAANGRGLETTFAPEFSLATPDLNARFPVLVGQNGVWDLVSVKKWLNAEGQPFVGVNLPNYCRDRLVKHKRIVLYALVCIDSPSEQDATLLFAAEDRFKAWLNGKLVHASDGRPDLDHPRRSRVTLKNGRNVVIVKVDHLDGPGRLCLSVASPSEVVLGVD